LRNRAIWHRREDRSVVMSVITWRRCIFSSYLISSRPMIKSERRCHHSGSPRRRRLLAPVAATARFTAAAAVMAGPTFACSARPSDVELSQRRRLCRGRAKVIGARNRHNRCTRSTDRPTDKRRPRRDRDRPTRCRLLIG